MLLESSADCRAKESEIQKIERDVATTKIAITETQTSFKYRVMSTLINTNINKYTFSTTAGRALRQTMINNDVYILEKKFQYTLKRLPKISKALLTISIEKILINRDLVDPEIRCRKSLRITMWNFHHSHPGPLQPRL